MWQNKFDSRLELEPRSSRYLLIYLVALHVLAILALLQPLVLPDWLRALLIIAVLVSLAWWVWRRCHDCRRLTRLVWRVDGDWDYQVGDRYRENLQLLPTSYITSWLMILHLQQPDRRRCYVVLLPDSLSTQQWHLLWLRLRYAGPFGQGRVTRDE